MCGGHWPLVYMQMRVTIHRCVEMRVTVSDYTCEARVTIHVRQE